MNTMCSSNPPSLTLNNGYVIRRGIYRYLDNVKDYVLIFIHDLQSWTVTRLWEFLSKRISNCNNIIHGIVKKHTINMENYFIIRVNYNKPTYYLNILYIITQALPVTRINWKIIIPSASSKNRKSKHQHKLFYSNDSIPLSNDFLFTNPLSPLPLFNFCSCWNINGWNSEKRDGIIYFNSIFKPICIYLQEVGNSHFLNNFNSDYPFLPQYNFLIRRADPNIPGIRGLFIGIHKSCSFLPDPFEYNYIISANIISFWGKIFSET